MIIDFNAYLGHSKEECRILQGFPPDERAAIGNRHTDQFPQLQMLVDPRKDQTVRIISFINKQDRFLKPFPPWFRPQNLSSRDKFQVFASAQEGGQVIMHVAARIPPGIDDKSFLIDLPA